MTKWYLISHVRSTDGDIIGTLEYDAESFTGLVFAPPSENKIEWDIASTDTPYYDGGDVTNRVARRREITLVWAYDNQHSVDADDGVFSALSPAITSNGLSQTVTIKKVENYGEQNAKTKYIDGVIQSITRPEIKRKKHLQIVFDCDPFWRGEKVQETITSPSAAIGDETFLLQMYNGGEVAVPFDLDIHLTITSGAGDILTEVVNAIEAESASPVSFGGFSFIGAGSDYQDTEIRTADGNYSIKIVDKEDRSRKVSVMNSMNGMFFDLLSKAVNNIQVTMSPYNSPVEYTVDSFVYSYTPLYVR